MHAFIRKGDSLRGPEGARGTLDEHRNSQKPEGLLRALFDDQVHDSRAWFLHALFNNSYLGVGLVAGREPWGSYFNERMVFFGEADRRDLALRVEPDGESALVASIAETSGQTQAMPAEYAQQRAQLQQRITAVWDAHYAKVKEARDGQV